MPEVSLVMDPNNAIPVIHSQTGNVRTVTLTTFDAPRAISPLRSLPDPITSFRPGLRHGPAARSADAGMGPNRHRARPRGPGYTGNGMLRR
jgi:hypothetical protein